MVKKLILKKIMSDQQVEALKGKFLEEDNMAMPVITEDTDAYTTDGKLLLRFRKNVIPLEILKLGYESFKNSIEWTEGRGLTSGYSGKRIKKDGTVSNITVGAKVQSGNIGAMDPSAMVKYCRKTGFSRRYFEEFTQGIPFVQAVDKLYQELVPENYAIQKAYCEGTDMNWVIADTAFTTITMNKSFRTACHTDSGDLPEGFGNLIVYNDGSYTGGYFILPQYGIGVDLQNGDCLFVDVHKHHGNSELCLKEGFDEIFRISWVLYYRQYLLKCGSPEEELINTKIRENGFFRL